MTATTSTISYSSKMHHLQLLALMAAAANAAPAFFPLINNGTSPTKVSYNAETLDACTAAPNCDTYKTARGQAIRFIPGMEPGSN